MPNDRPVAPARLDAIIIGAGHNGLVAASYLARAGLDVLVLEASDAVGGLCQTREVLPGFRGNMAANSSHNLDPLVAADMGLTDHGLEWIEVGTPSSVAFLPGPAKLVGYKDPEKIRAEFAQFSATDAEGYAETMAEMVALGRKLNVSFYEAPPRFADVAQRVAPGREEEFFARVMFGSAFDVAAERLQSEEVRASLCMLAVAGNFIGPSTPGSAYALMQRPMYRGAGAALGLAKVALTPEFAAAAPRGGMGAITQAMARSASSAGAQIHTESRVTRIKCGPAGVEGVLLDNGHEFDARIIVSAMNPKSTLLDLVPAEALDESLRSSLRQVRMDGCLAKIYLALDGVPRFAAARNEDENRMLLRCGFRAGPSVAQMDRSYELALAGDWSGEPIIYGLVQTALDDSLAPQGKHLMSLSVSFAPYRLASGNWREGQRGWMDHVIRWLSQHIPNLPDIISDYGCLTTADLESRFGLLEGNALHGDVTVGRMFNWRPLSGCSNYTTPVNGLYLCSNGTWPANYLSGLPGRNAALTILANFHDPK